jgi:hypothetical protein
VTFQGYSSDCCFLAFTLVASFSVSVNFRPVDNASKAYIILIVNYGSFNYMGANSCIVSNLRLTKYNLL